jgi:hypothetical protein
MYPAGRILAVMVKRIFLLHVQSVLGREKKAKTIRAT